MLWNFFKLHAMPFLFLILLLVPAFGAPNLSSIEGRVVDAKNVPVPGATVRLLTGDPGPPAETLTEIDGTFKFSDLPSGTYQLIVEMAAFQRLTMDSVDPAAGRPLNLTLHRLEPSRSLDARSRPQERERTRTDTGPQPDNVTSFQEVELSRNSAENTAVAASDVESGVSVRQDNSDLLVISGSSGASFASGDWNDPAFRERMMEMRERLGFGFGDGPIFGSREGGSGGSGRGDSVRFTGMRGSGRGQSRINGSLQLSYRNSVFNARPYSITGKEISKPLQIQNNFGASVGGPLPGGAKPSGNRRIQQPGMWFFSYEGSRNRNPFEILTTVPTELERSGDFSQTSLRAGPLAGRNVAIYDPTASTVFPENRIPASRMNPATVRLLSYIPLPNLPGSVQNFALHRGLVNRSDGFSGRLTTRLSSKDNAFFNYSLRTSQGVSSQLFPGLDTERDSRSQNAVIGGMHRFQPRLVLNYRIQFNRVRTLTSNPFAFKQDVAGEIAIQGISRDPINFGIPSINFTNYGDLQLGYPSLSRTQALGIGGGLNKIGSKHTIQIGGEFSWNQRNNQLDPNARGTFDFTGFASSAFDTQGRPVAGTGYDLADFLLGFPYATSRRFGSSNNYLRNKSSNVFIQDNWRVRPNMTVNLGLRYEYIQPFYEKYNRLVSLDVAPGFSAVAQVFPGRNGPYSGEFPRSLIYADKNNFGPRVGIAWKPKANSRWVFRTGYGLLYNPSVYPYIYGQLVGQPPIAVNQNILTNLANPLTLQNGFPFDPNVTILNSYSIDPHYRIGYVQQWNFNIQGQIWKIYTLEAGYNGSKGTRLDVLRAPNRAPPGISPGNTEENRLIGNAGNFVYQGSGANSILHGLQIRGNRRFSRGFRMETSYAFSKSIDNASGLGGSSLIVVQDERNILAERSLSSFDQRHRFQSEFNIELPFGERRKLLSGAAPVVLAFVSGWNINGSYQLNSGTPLTARILGNLSNNSGTGSNASERPDSTGATVPLSRDERSTARFFNTHAFAIPAPGRFGNAARYIIPGPGSNLLNLSLRKNFRLGDSSRRAEFRWQVSNVLNHANFAGVATVINALNFGRVTGARSMRQMEFNLRLSF